VLWANLEVKMVLKVMDRGNGTGGEKLWLEGNFTQVPNDIIESLARTHLSPNESKIVFLVIRKTYGWHKLSDWIALSQIAKYTGIARPNTCRYIKSLVRRNILVRPDNKHVGLQEDTTKWLDKRQSSSLSIV